MSMRPVLLLSGLLATCPAVLQAAEPEKAPTTQKEPASQRKSGVARLRDAVKELVNEYQDHEKGGSKPLRAEANYFEQGLPDGVSPNDLVNVLQKSAHDTDRIDAYVRWQLLSGLPEELEREHVSRLLQVYKTAPKPEHRPGVSPSSRQEMDRVLQQNREASPQQINDEFDKALARLEARNRPIFALRDELLQRLPPSQNLFTRAFEDLYERMQGGWRDQMGDLLDEIEKRIGVWAASTAEQNDLRELADLLGRLRSEEAIEYYDSVDTRGGALRWRERRIDLDTREISELQQDLYAKANAPTSDRKKRKY
jgi:hypothetical protein